MKSPFQPGDTVARRWGASKGRHGVVVEVWDAHPHHTRVRWESGRETSVLAAYLVRVVAPAAASAEKVE
jgi:hypothetical protein